MPDADYLEIFADDKARSRRIPLRMDTDRARGFFDEERDIFIGYTETGDLMNVQDTRRGKTLYPVRQEDPHIGRYDDLLVYFIQAATGQIKIGIAAEPAARMRSLQTGSPVTLTLLTTCAGGRPQESAYHVRFTEHRLHGEWFAPHPDILAEIERLSA